MAVKTYQGIAYRQNTSASTPWMVSFVAPAEELRSWAGIPRRSDQGLIGFQRVDDQRRVERAREFFDKHEANQSPTSIVIGIHPPANGQSPRVQLEFNETEGNIRSCRLIVAEEDACPLDEIIEVIRCQIMTRLDDGSATATDDVDDEAEVSDEEGNDDDEADGKNEGPEEIELGRSLLRELLTKLDDAQWCLDHEEDLRDLAKPATIIDGQHRIKGAELCERGIPFNVCAIYNCEWSEQVFQFTVVNYTAQGIPDQFITANAVLSLTSSELQALQNRLIQANVKVIDYELMRVINFDETSPFYNLVNLTTKKQEDKLGFRTMVSVGKSWYAGKHPAVAQIIDHLYPDIKGKKGQAKAQRLQRWKDEHWGLFFKDFWNVVKDHYADSTNDSGSPIWAVGESNLLLTVVLSELQEAFLTNLAAQDESFFEAGTEDPVGELRKKIRNRAEKFISYFEADFFGRNWKMKSLSTGVGRTALKDTFRRLVDAKGNFKYANSNLVTGKTS